MCDNSFKGHESTHTGEKLYICAKCEKSFSDSCELRGHEIMHTKQIKWEARVAQVAAVVANYHPHLPRPETHAREHTGEKPFSSTWDKSFVSHETTHTGEKRNKK